MQSRLDFVSFEKRNSELSKYKVCESNYPEEVHERYHDFIERVMVYVKLQTATHLEEVDESINQKAYRLKQIQAAHKVNPNYDPRLLSI